MRFRVIEFCWLIFVFRWIVSPIIGFSIFEILQRSVFCIVEMKQCVAIVDFRKTNNKKVVGKQLLRYLAGE